MTGKPGLAGFTMAAAIALQSTCAPAAEPVLDYDFFKARVEPIFLKKRPDHVRCYVCHSEANTALKLQALPEGKQFWTEEQSHKQFEIVSRLVVPGEPMKSRLLLQPLALESGGNPYHSGGRQFTKNDPEWKTLADWVNGATLKAK